MSGPGSTTYISQIPCTKPESPRLTSIQNMPNEPPPTGDRGQENQDSPNKTTRRKPQTNHTSAGIDHRLCTHFFFHAVTQRQDFEQDETGTRTQANQDWIQIHGRGPRPTESYFQQFPKLSHHGMVVIHYKQYGNLKS